MKTLCNRGWGCLDFLQNSLALLLAWHCLHFWNVGSSYLAKISLFPIAQRSDVRQGATSSTTVCQLWPGISFVGISPSLGTAPTSARNAYWFLAGNLAKGRAFRWSWSFAPQKIAGHIGLGLSTRWSQIWLTRRWSGSWTDLKPKTLAAELVYVRVYV